MKTYSMDLRVRVLADGDAGLVVSVKLCKKDHG